MCKSSLHPLLAALPKVEHHMHIEGALQPSMMMALAQKNKISLPLDDEAFASISALNKRYSRFTSLDDFLHYYYIGMSVLINSEDYEELAWDYFKHAAADGVAHAELFFDPQAHLSRGVSYFTVVSGITRARKRAQAEFGITTELICCFLRHLPVEDSLKTFDDPDVQSAFQDYDICGIGLVSTEKEKPPQLWSELYAKAGARNLRLTAHAGEEGPAEYIAGAIQHLGATRIDHGIHLADSPALMQEIAAKKIMLTVCPISNLVLRCVSSISELPIRKFLDAGVRFSINSDDPAYFGGYILDNYCAVAEAFGLTVGEIQTIGRNAIEGSWCSDARKEELLAKLEAVVKDHR